MAKLKAYSYKARPNSALNPDYYMCGWRGATSAKELKAWIVKELDAVPIEVTDEKMDWDTFIRSPAGLGPNASGWTGD